MPQSNYYCVALCGSSIIQLNVWELPGREVERLSLLSLSKRLGPCRKRRKGGEWPLRAGSTRGDWGRHLKSRGGEKAECVCGEGKLCSDDAGTVSTWLHAILSPPALMRAWKQCRHEGTNPNLALFSRKSEWASDDSMS